MENENLDQENNLIGDYYFKTPYKIQNYKLFPEYQTWKKNVIEKIGENGKEILCPKDDTIIYKIHNDNNIKITCPNCKINFYHCIFCNLSQTEKCHICCLRAYFKYIFKNHYKYRFEYDNNNNFHKDNFHRLIFISLMPIISVLLVTFAMINLFYMNLGKNNISSSIHYDEKPKIYQFIILFLITLFMLLMSLSYTIIYFFSFFALLIISLPFKLYFVRLYLGIIDCINDDELDMI